LTTTNGYNALFLSTKDFDPKYKDTPNETVWSSELAKGNWIDIRDFSVHFFRQRYYQPVDVIKQSNGTYLVVRWGGQLGSQWKPSYHFEYMQIASNNNSRINNATNNWKTAVTIFDSIPFTATSAENVALNDRLTNLNNLAVKINAKLQEIVIIHEKLTNNTNNGLNI
jgi:hypothetical protein